MGLFVILYNSEIYHNLLCSSIPLYEKKSYQIWEKTTKTATLYFVVKIQGVVSKETCSSRRRWAYFLVVSQFFCQWWLNLIDIYIRITIRRYWMKKASDDKLVSAWFFVCFTTTEDFCDGKVSTILFILLFLNKKKYCSTPAVTNFVLFPKSVIISV